jgi:peptidoglycan hydrolase-like protein with peptidoglycan-binding domain
MSLLSSRLKNNARLSSAEALGKLAIGKGEGDKEAVALLQSCMEEIGLRFVRSKIQPNGRLDGVFGEETEKIIKEFQRQRGLSPDGLVGPRTLGVLDAMYVAYERADAVRLAMDLRSPASRWEMT